MVDECRYLGYQLHWTLRDDCAIRARMAAGSALFGSLRKDLLGTKEATMKVKRTVFVGMVVPMMLYGSEVWIVSKKMEQEICTTYRRMVRSMLRVNLFTTRRHHIRHVDLLEKVGIEDIMTYIDRRRLGWAGHVARMPPSRLPRKLLTSYGHTPRRVGAPCLTYGRILTTSLRRKVLLAKEKENRNVSSPSWIAIAQDRLLWRSLISAKKVKICRQPSISAHPQLLIGRTIEKRFKATWHVGQVTSFDIDEATQETIWHVQYADGDAADYNAADMTRITISDDDQLAEATRRLEQPQILMGRRFRKLFGAEQHHGEIIGHDEDEATGDVIWEVLFEDGDKSDYNLHDTTKGLL
jgi:hypothetical protein